MKMTLALGGLAIACLLASCADDIEINTAPNNQISFHQQLSEYAIFQGDPSELMPTEEYQPYLLGATLFTDHAEKQRLIKLPAGTRMEREGDGLPFFPDGTVLVKTFFYYFDKRVPASGKQIIETRLLIKQQGRWHVATYLWNDSQSDATLLTGGLDTIVNYVNEEGQATVINYHVPDNAECATCHLSNDDLTPLGPKLRNLNRMVETAAGTQNQLQHLQELQLLNEFDPELVAATPDYKNVSFALDVRARAYFDANCGHCHNATGWAAETNLFLNAEVSLAESDILDDIDDIREFLNDGTMPLLGTTVLDKKGIAIIEAYLNTLPGG